jgi:hypothetical protein
MSLFGRLIGRRRPRWDESWRSYPGTIGQQPAQWTVDLGAIDAAPVAELPVRLDLSGPVPPGPDGAGADPAVVAQLEDAVRAAVENLGGVYIGRMVSPQLCQFTAHLPAEPAEPVVVAGVGPALTAYDPHWAFVRDTLAPDERQHQLLVDLAAVDELAGHGDTLGTPREVAHTAYFAAQEPAESAAADLRADGFTAAVYRDDEGEFALTALRRDPVEPPRVHELAWGVRETVERHGGTYDGWNCDVARAA